MNIRVLFGQKKIKAMDSVDRIIYEKLTQSEANKVRDDIAAQFDSLLDAMHDYNDIVEAQQKEIKENHELIKLLCKKVGP